MLLCPILVFFARIALEAFGGSLSEALSQFLVIGSFEFAARYTPAATFKASAGYIGWLLFQAMLYTFLPSKLGTGQLTPAGYLLQYRINGLLAWLLTHIAFVTAVVCGALDSAIIAKNWAGLLVAANAYGFLLSAFTYFKAYCYPTHAEDRKFSGRSQVT
jgi:7-dehydrocholesterol reductase